MMKEEGLKNIFTRHEKHKLAISSAAEALNLRLFAQKDSLSPSVTAIETKDLDAENFRKSIKEKYDILLAGGQDQLKGKIFRVGHLGYINDQDIISVISAIGLSLLDKNKISFEDVGVALGRAENHLGN